VNLRSFLFWRKKPTVESVSTAVSVRNALHICVDDFVMTDEQFEELYCAVLENEVCRYRSAGEIINEFVAHYDLKRTPESIERYRKFTKSLNL
jgi:hypothetical protein